MNGERHTEQHTDEMPESKAVNKGTKEYTGAFCALGLDWDRAAPRSDLRSACCPRNLFTF